MSQEVSSKNERDFHSRETNVVKKIAGDSSRYVSSHLNLIVESCVKFAFALGLKVHKLHNVEIKLSDVNPLNSTCSMHLVVCYVHTETQCLINI